MINFLLLNAFLIAVNSIIIYWIIAALVRLKKKTDESTQDIVDSIHILTQKLNHFQNELKIPEPVFHVKQPSITPKPRVTRRTDSIEYELELPKEKMGEKFF